MPGPVRVSKLLETLGINPETVLVIRNDADRDITYTLPAELELPQGVSVGRSVTLYTEPGEAFSGAPSTRWDDVAWRGDRLHRQLVLWSAQGTTLDGLKLEVSDLVSGAAGIPASALRVRYERYVKGDPEPLGCGTHPAQAFVEVADALSSKPVTMLTSDDPLKLWLTLDVPESTSPGVYSGTLRASDGAAHTATFTLRIRVLELVLPPVDAWSFHLDLWQYPSRILSRYNDAHPGGELALWSPGHLALLEPAYRLLADTGQKAITAHIKENALGGPSMIRRTRKADGSWEYDFAAFDAYVEALDSWGLGPQIDCFSVVAAPLKNNRIKSDLLP